LKTCHGLREEDDESLVDCLWRRLRSIILIFFGFFLAWCKATYFSPSTCTEGSKQIPTSEMQLLCVSSLKSKSTI